MTFVHRLRNRFAGSDSAGQWPDFLEPHRDPMESVTPIAEAAGHVPVRIAGRIKSVRVQPMADVSTLRCTVVDDTGEVVVVFLGRRHVGGIETGRHVVVEGVIGEHLGRRRILNPVYRLL
jgi:hypothetical protein